MTMSWKRSLVVATTATLVACGGDSSSGPGTTESGAPSVLPGDPRATYQVSYPHEDGHARLPVTSSMAIHFADSVYQTAIPETVDVYYRLESGDFGYVPIRVQYADRGRTLVITPEESLEPAKEYSLGWSVGLRNFRTEFVTQGDPDGPPAAQAENPDHFGLPLWSLYPGTPGPAAPHTDFATFSTINLRFTQPIDPATVRYGDGVDDNVWLENTATGEFVDAYVVVDGSILVVDPKEDLDTGVRYKLHFLEDDDPDGMKSTLGEIYDPSRYSLLNYTPSDEFHDDEEWPKTVTLRLTSPNNWSRMTNDKANTLSPKVGDGQTLQLQTGYELQADMEYTEVTNFPERNYSPLRITRESLNASPMGAQLETMAADESGDAPTIRFLTDATGEIRYKSMNNLRNDWADTARLLLNVGVTPAGGGEERQVHLELSGFVSRHGDDTFSVDLYGSFDPAVLDQEAAPGNGGIALQLKSE